MNKREEIKRIYRDCFNDSDSYIELVFDRVYRDGEAMLHLGADGQPVSALLLRRYEMSFHGSIVPTGYIFGAGTRRKQRGKGYMGQLILEALRFARERGDMMVSLIPASAPLFYYYASFGFKSVFYVKEQRFTAFHAFPGEDGYHPMENNLSDECWEAFNRFQTQRKCAVLHTRSDYFNIVEDNRLDGGDIAVMEADDDDCGSRIVSMAFSVLKDGIILVTDLMGESRDARVAALRQLRALHSDMPMLLLGYPDDPEGGRLIPRAMGRIVNAELCLQTVAAAHTGLHCTIRISDPLLGDLNSGVFAIADGMVSRLAATPAKLDFDVPVDVFTAMVFSSGHIGEILGFPAVRPRISLMLD